MKAHDLMKALRLEIEENAPTAPSIAIAFKLAHSLDPQLDANSKSAFAQWKFQPSSKAGTPVDLEVTAHIPFKIADDR